MATYPSPPFPGGYPSPFPYTFSSYPAPASSFSPAPACGSPNLPCTATYQQPFPFTPHAFPYPPPASAYTPASGFSPNWQTWPPPSPDPTSSAATYHHHFPLATDLSCPTPRLLDPIPTAPSRERCKSQRHPSTASVPTSSLQVDLSYSKTALPPSKVTSGCASVGLTVTELHTHEVPHTAENDAAVLAATDHRAQAKDGTRHRQHLEFLNLQARLDKQMGRDQTSLDKIHGELSKLSALVSQFTVAMGMETTEAPVTGSSPAATPAQFSSPATTPSMFPSTASASVAPQMFSEMPKSYGFHNLNRQSITLADGTKRSYFTLPEDYPLERATPPMSPPAGNIVGVMVPLSVAAHEEGLAPVLCSKTNNATGSESLLVPNLQQRLNVQDVSLVFTKTPVYDIHEEEDSSCLNTISNVRDFSLEMLQQNVERACNCPVLKASDSLVTGSSQLSVDHSTSELRLLWDPGDTKLSVLFTTAAGATKLQCIDVYNHKMVHVLPVKFGSTPYQQSYAEEQQDSEQLPMQISKAPEPNQTSACWYYITDELDYALKQQQHDEKVSGNVQQPRAPALNVLVLHERRKEWDPGDNCFGQRVNLKQFWAQLLLQSHSWYNTLTAFLQVHYCCLPIVLDCSYSETVQQLVGYSRMFSFSATILSAMCMSTSTAVRMIVVLSSGKIAQEGRNAAVVYHIFEIQLPITKTSHIWDPGIESLFFSCKRLNIPMLIQIKGWTSMTYTGISSSEYAYTMDFVHDQWEFLHQQGVQKKYNAKNLLYSHLYLQLWEMDIIFITFLPP